MSFQRSSGVLLHPTSFPNKFGIGSLGKAAYDWLDWLESAGQKLWQILPLGHTGYGDSPYQSFCASAGNPLLIDLELLVKDSLLIVEGQVSMDEYTGGFKMAAEKLYNMDQARAAFSKRLLIEVNAEQAGNGFVDELKEILSPAMQGKCPVYLRYRSLQAEAEIALGEEWKISPTHVLLDRLSRLAGECNVHLVY